jgi:hypothetical protein
MNGTQKLHETIQIVLTNLGAFGFLVLRGLSDSFCQIFKRGCIFKKLRNNYVSERISGVYYSTGKNVFWGQRSLLDTSQITHMHAVLIVKNKWARASEVFLDTPYPTVKTLLAREASLTIITAQEPKLPAVSLGLGVVMQFILLFGMLQNLGQMLSRLGLPCAEDGEAMGFHDNGGGFCVYASMRAYSAPRDQRPFQWIGLSMGKQKHSPQGFQQLSPAQNHFPNPYPKRARQSGDPCFCVSNHQLRQCPLRITLSFVAL